MSKGGPTKEAFEKLLSWLDSDREKAGEKYEIIRFRLIRIFASRGCGEADELADLTLNVVCARIDWLVANYEGDPALFFYGVAKKIFLEQQKKKPIPPPPPPPDVTEIENKCGCLEECLKKQLSLPEQRLVLRYHETEKHAKIVLRKQLAEEAGVSINALRIRVHKMHTRLRPCIEECLKHVLEQ
jgi:hypothetical protein